MTTAPKHPRRIQGLDISRPEWALFTKMFAEIYLNASEEIKEVIKLNRMIVRDHSAGEDERNAALDTLVDVFLPPSPPEQLSDGTATMASQRR